MILARKINKIPEFYTIIARKMPEFYIIIARKLFFPEFWGHMPLPAPRLLCLWASEFSDKKAIISRKTRPSNYRH